MTPARIHEGRPEDRLRAQDIHKIVDVFTNRLDVPQYARMVGIEEIEKNDFNLNLPRYIDSQPPEDIQDIEGHLLAASPRPMSMRCDRYRAVCPQLRKPCSRPNRPGYLDLAVEKPAIKSTIYQHPEFAAFIAAMNSISPSGARRSTATLKALSRRLPSEAGDCRVSRRTCSRTTAASR